MAVNSETWRSLVLLSHTLEESLDRQSRRDGGIPHAYYKLLVFLYEGQRLTMTELAAQLKYSSSRLTHAVASLERSGWARRIRSTEDKRVQFVELTDAGAHVVRLVTPGQVAEVRAPALAGLSAAEAETLARLARRVIANLEG